MYDILAFALIACSISWYMCMYGIWIIATCCSCLIVTVIHLKSLRADAFLRQSFHLMENTPCCCAQDIWSSPQSVMWTFTTLRGLSGLVSSIALIVTYTRSDSFVDGYHWTVIGTWTIALVFWFLSCIPLIICLIQCAAKTTCKTVMDIQFNNEILSEDKKIYIHKQCVVLAQPNLIIVRFRKSVFMWLIHDIVLGFFWLYLAIMLYDLTDDTDDSEWRTIFLSMMSWHIVFAVLHHLYLKKWWSCIVITPHTDDRACCAPSTADKWWALTQLFGMATIYLGFIFRMRQTTITDMGCSEKTLAIVIVGIVAFYIGEKCTENVFRGTIINQTPKSVRTDTLEKYPSFIKF